MSASILIVDDDSEVRGILDDLLKSEGHTTWVAASGQEAGRTWPKQRCATKARVGGGKTQAV